MAHIFSDKKIIESWNKNSNQWINAIRNNEIESRTLVTNAAIMNTIQSLPGSTVLDIGCGEGWLAHELSNSELNVLGIDVIPELINSAKEKKTSAEFKVLAYEEISSKSINESYDIAVCNFSLIGKESVEYLFKTLPTLLNPRAHFVIQTLNPDANDYQKTKDGWREGSWKGFSKAFIDPAPWYYRSLESWETLFNENGYQLMKIVEPTFTNSHKKASLIMVGQVI